MKNVMKIAMVALLSMMTTGVFATAKNHRHAKAKKPLIAINKQEVKAKEEKMKEEKKEGTEKKMKGKHHGEKKSHKKHSEKTNNK